jgi:hypothetical protein
MITQADYFEVDNAYSQAKEAFYSTPVPKGEHHQLSRIYGRDGESKAQEFLHELGATDEQIEKIIPRLKEFQELMLRRELAKREWEKQVDLWRLQHGGSGCMAAEPPDDKPFSENREKHPK